MNILVFPAGRTSFNSRRGLWGRVGLAGLAGLAACAIAAPVVATVPVAHVPLTVSMPIAPNIVLMMDDSPSMLWNFMPDWRYLDNNHDKRAVIDASNNGIYYNPQTRYRPPPKADSTPERPHYYKNQTDIGHVPVNGFAADVGHDVGNDQPLAYVNLTHYDGVYERSEQGHGIGYGSAIEFSASRSRFGRKTRYYFQYSTGPARGPYRLHYVALTGQGCGDLDKNTAPTCVTANTVGDGSNGAPAGVMVGQNIANWFAWYHTRLLMVKSSMMTALLPLNRRYRFGFGAIGYDPQDALPGPSRSYGSGNNRLAQVQPFGDGSSTTRNRKADFWTWIAQKGVSTWGGTPLRRGLDAVGQYYQSDQPWQAMSSDAVAGARPGNTKPLACRQSYVLLTTDGFWNGDAAPGVGSQDDTSGPTITGPGGKTYTYRPRPPYTGGFADSLADVAMKYWKHDLRKTMANQVPASKDDPAFWQHMVTFTIGLGYHPRDADKKNIPMDRVFSWARGNVSDAIQGFRWPRPTKENISTIADLAHAAVNGHGGFYSAGNPQKITDAVRGVMARIAERQGSDSGLAANSTQLETGASAYQASYTTAAWKGNLKALALKTDGSTARQIWSAADKLPSASDRKIYTCNPRQGCSSLVAFSPDHVAELSLAQRQAMGSDTGSQRKIVNYLRGDPSLEQGQASGVFRQRDTALGDIVHSRPIYVGAPDSTRFTGQDFSGSGQFAAYAQNSGQRRAMVYVAANDGMLHGFYAAGNSPDTSRSGVKSPGTEAFAYIPAAVITHGSVSHGTTHIRDGHYVGLSALADPDYGSADQVHEYFNDGELTVADAWLSGKWHTVLVGTTGRGLARAVYALDVTRPASITLLWERSATDGKPGSDHIGQITGRPVIAQVANGQWAVLLGNGYNSKAGVSALLEFNLADGSLTVHATGSASTSNGLAAPTVWIDKVANGIATTAYAGDLQGGVWAFPLHGGDKGVRPRLLFTAVDAQGRPQPITAGMLAGRDPATGRRWVFFGTGRYLARQDITDKHIQTWYGLIVKADHAGQLVKKLTSDGDGVNNKNLVQRRIIAELPADVRKGVPALRVISLDVSGDMKGKSGWFMNMGQLSTPVTDASGTTSYTISYPHPGERMSTPNQFQGKFLVGTSRTADVTGLCKAAGSGWIMAVNPFTGANPRHEFFDPEGKNHDYKVTVGGKDYYVGGVGFDSPPNNPLFIGNHMITSSDNGRINHMHIYVGGQTQRVSWRELVGP